MNFWIRRTAALALAALLLLGAGAGAITLTTRGPVKIKAFPHGLDKTGRVSAGGRVLEVGGRLACTRHGRIRVYVTVTQRKTGAFARGTWRGACTGREQKWLVRKARARGGADFDPGQTEACAAAVGRNVRRATDATQWCGAVLLRH